MVMLMLLGLDFYFVVQRVNKFGIGSERAGRIEPHMWQDRLNIENLLDCLFAPFSLILPLSFMFHEIGVLELAGEAKVDCPYDDKTMSHRKRRMGLTRRE
jgi:hypothetical protein